jgi:hypothetical protein
LVAEERNGPFVSTSAPPAHALAIVPTATWLNRIGDLLSNRFPTREAMR